MIKEVLIKRKKELIIVGVILIVMIGLMVLLNIKSKVKKETTKTNIDSYVMLNGCPISFIDGKYSKINSTKVEGQEFRIVTDNTYYGNYTFNEKNENEYIFSKDGEKYKIYTPYIAVGEHINYIKYEIKEMNSSDLSNLRTNGNLNKSIKMDDFDYANKVVLDFDNDNNEETIYYLTYTGVNDLSNDPEDLGDIEYNSNAFSIVYYQNDDVLTTILESKVNNNELSQYNLAYILDFNLDSEYEIVISDTKYDYDLYKLLNLNNNCYEVILNNICL